MATTLGWEVKKRREGLNGLYHSGAAVLREAGVPLSWTSEGAGTLFAVSE